MQKWAQMLRRHVVLLGLARATPDSVSVMFLPFQYDLGSFYAAFSAKKSPGLFASSVDTVKSSTHVVVLCPAAACSSVVAT